MIEEEKQDKDDAREELKRADHLIYVSLKYTRTIDVILSVIARLVSAQEILIDGLLKVLKKKKKMEKINLARPFSIKIGWMREGFKKDKNVNELLDFYELLVRIMKAKHGKRGEYRKGLTLIAYEKKDELIEEVNVDVLKEYYNKTEDFTDKIEKIIK